MQLGPHIGPQYVWETFLPCYNEGGLLFWTTNWSKRSESDRPVKSVTPRYDASSLKMFPKNLMSSCYSSLILIKFDNFVKFFCRVGCSMFINEINTENKIPLYYLKSALLSNILYNSPWTSSWDGIKNVTTSRREISELLKDLGKSHKRLLKPTKS